VQNFDTRFARQKELDLHSALGKTNLLRKLCFDLFYFILFMPPLTPDSPLLTCCHFQHFPAKLCACVYDTTFITYNVEQMCIRQKVCNSKTWFRFKFQLRVLSKLNLFAERIHLEIIE